MPRATPRRFAPRRGRCRLARDTPCRTRDTVCYSGAMKRLAPWPRWRCPACGSPSQTKPCTGWTQWSQSASHAGDVCVTGQAPANILASVTVDPFASTETFFAGGDILVHYQVPLVVDDDVYTLHKLGAVLGARARNRPTAARSSATSGTRRSGPRSTGTGRASKLKFDWSVGTDWKPVPSEVAGSEPLFQPVIVGDNLYMPAQSARSCASIAGPASCRRASSPSSSRPIPYITGPLVADAGGNIYYNVVSFAPGTPLGSDAKGWLVRIAPDDTFTAVSYDTLVAERADGDELPRDLRRDEPGAGPAVAAAAERRRDAAVAAAHRVRLAAARRQRRADHRARRHDLHRQPRALLVARQLRRRRQPRPHAQVGGAACAASSTTAAASSCPSDGDAGQHQCDCRPGVADGVDATPPASCPPAASSTSRRRRRWRCPTAACSTARYTSTTATAATSSSSTPRASRPAATTSAGTTRRPYGSTTAPTRSSSRTTTTTTTRWRW